MVESDVEAGFSVPKSCPTAALAQEKRPLAKGRRCGRRREGSAVGTVEFRPPKPGASAGAGRAPKGTERSAEVKP